ncbi:phospholipase A [Amphritea sp.]|uniref:phospholipase A n=1 Tax=Amphritea sp. TaxID=1872502 RepID=UPI003A92DAF4
MKMVLSILVASLVQLPWQSATAADALTQCLQEQLAHAADDQTVGQLKAVCRRSLDDQDNGLVSAGSVFGDTSLAGENPESAVQNRLEIEAHYEDSMFSLIPHNPNYIIVSHNFAEPNDEPFKNAFPNRDINLEPLETKFQISVKVPLAKGLWDGNGDLYAAYTGRFFWQQFNKSSSSPFRETDHEPELWIAFNNDAELWGFRNSLIMAGLVHQSNGQAGSLSRSWNRVYANFIIEKGNAYFSFKPWIRLSEDFDDDDNPDIEDYMGNFELTGIYKWGTHSFSLKTRHNLNFSDSHGAAELGWTFPLTDNLSGYVQWFNGYGESLIDYNAYSNSLGVGVKLSDWL